MFILIGYHNLFSRLIFCDLNKILKVGPFQGTLLSRINAQALIGIQGYSFLNSNKRTGPNKRTETIFKMIFERTFTAFKNMNYAQYAKLGIFLHVFQS